MNEIANSLRLRGYDPDFDRSTHDNHNVDSGISAEDEWWIRLQEMIAACDIMIFLVSPASVKSDVCDEEIAYARGIGKRIIAVKASDIDFRKAPPRLAAMNVKIDFSKGADHFEEAICELSAALSVNLPWLREGRRLAIKLNEWTRNNCPDELLLRGIEIHSAEKWISNRPVNEEDLGEQFHEFLNASQELEERIRKESQNQIAEKEKQLKRISRQQLVGAIGLLIFLISVIVAAYLTIISSRNVGLSESSMLATAAQTSLDEGNTQQGLRLAALATRETFLNPSNQFAQKTLVNAAQKTSVEYQYKSSLSIAQVEYNPETNDLIIQELQNETSDSKLYSSSRLNLNDFSLSQGSKKIEITKPSESDRMVNLLAELSGDRNIVSNDDLFTLTIKKSRLSKRKELKVIQKKTGISAIFPNLKIPICEWEDAIFSPDNKQLLVWAHDGSLAKSSRCFALSEVTSYLVDLSELEKKDIDPLPLSGIHVIGGSFSHDGHSLLIWDAEQRVHLWNIGKAASVSIDRFPERVEGANFSSDGHLFTVWGNSVVHVYETDRASRPINAQVLNFSPEQVLLVDQGKYLVIWGETSITVQKTSRINSPFSEVFTFRHPGNITDILVNRDNSRAISVIRDNQISLWDLTQGSEIPIKNIAETTKQTHFSGDGKFFFAITNSDADTLYMRHNICRWNTKTGEQIKCIQVQSSIIYIESVSDDGSAVIYSQYVGGDNLQERFQISFEGDETPVLLPPRNLEGTIFTLDHSRQLIVKTLEENYEIYLLSNHSDKPELIAVDKRDGTGGSEDIVLSKTGRYLAFAGQEGVDLFDVDKRTFILRNPNVRHSGNPFIDEDNGILWFISSGGIYRIDFLNSSSTEKSHSVMAGNYFQLVNMNTRLFSFNHNAFKTFDTILSKDITPWQPLHDEAIVGYLYLEQTDYHLTWTESGEIKIWKVDWLEEYGDANRFLDTVCEKLFIGNTIMAPIVQATNENDIDTSLNRDPMISPRHGAKYIMESDVKEAPILNGRIGEDVCARPRGLSYWISR